MEIDEPRYAMRAAGSGCVRPGWFWVGPQLPKLPRNKDHHCRHPQREYFGARGGAL